MQQSTKPGGIRRLLQTINEYIKLLVEDARLNAAEKLTRLLSACVLFMLLALLVTVAALFLTVAVCLALSEAISPLWAFVIVTLFYVLVIVMVVTCRRTLIENPIARFISSLLVAEPAERIQNPEEE